MTAISPLPVRPLSAPVNTDSMSLGVPLLGGVELGGTKCICLIGSGPQDIRAQRTIATGLNPDATLAAIVSTFDAWHAQFGAVSALGIASFGPLELAPHAANYGFITTTPKPGWADTDVAGNLGRALRVPVGFDTDVDGALLAEARWGAAQGIQDLAYITVGTGIGVGLMVGGRLVLGFTHGELGHIRVARAPGDAWSGSCPFHADCLEGLASGTAIEKRTGAPASSLAENAPVWTLVAHALAQLLHTLVLGTAPRRILLGGGVMIGQPHLIPRLRKELQRSLNHYVRAAQISDDISQYIVAAGLAERAGPLGALALAANALARAEGLSHAAA